MKFAFQRSLSNSATCEGMESDNHQNCLQIRIDRPLYENDQLRQDLRYEKQKKTFFTRFCGDEKPTFKNMITSTVPALSWLPRYRWKEEFMPDLISGITVAIMHIPQGMAYALLGNVPPIIGIYMAFFPVLVYFFFGTSKHNSMGTFSIACLMTGKAVLEYADHSFLGDTVSISNTTVTGFTPVQVACAVTFVSAVVQLLMYVLHLGAASALLSEMLVNAFTAGAAVQVISTQVKDLLGLSLPKFKGYFTVINTISAIISNLENVNYAALLSSAVTITILSFNNEVLKPIVAKRTTIPIPIELIAVVSGTLICQYSNLHETYNIKIVGDIPTGLPQPELPPFSLLSSVLIDGFSVAIVSYVTSLSLALMLAQRGDYEVDANQELLAMAAGNVFGSLFSCMPICASLSRSMIQQVVGGKTQIVSIVSCFILVFVLLWIGPFFELLPRSVLASIIVVSLKGMLMQIGDIAKFWRQSKLDALLWIVTFLTVVFVGMDIGLLVGVLMSLVTIFILGFKPHSCLMGLVPHTDIYLDVNKYKGAKELKGIKIFHYCGGLNFATKNIFRDELYRLVDVNPQKELICRNKLARKQEKIVDGEKKDNSEKMKKLHGKINTSLKYIIIDFSSVSYIDPSGVSMLEGVIKGFEKLQIPVFIAGCSDRVYNSLVRCELIPKEKESGNIKTFLSVHDAVQYTTFLLGSEEFCISRIT
nr:solute carrier family 26 member 10-like isoform X1 [Leptinotarsa decemlineata]